MIPVPAVMLRLVEVRQKFPISADGYALLLTVRFVVPGDPASPLLFMLDGTERARMPPDAPLPAVDVELFERWVVAGAAR